MAHRTLPRRPADATSRQPSLVVVPLESSFAAVAARALRCRRCSVMLADEDGNLIIEESVGLPVELQGAA